MRGHTLERLQTRTMQTGDLDSSFDDRSRNVATGEPQLGPPQIRGVSPMESIAELPVQAVLDSSDTARDPRPSGGLRAPVGRGEGNSNSPSSAGRALSAISRQ